MSAAVGNMNGAWSVAIGIDTIAYINNVHKIIETIQP